MELKLNNNLTPEQVKTLMEMGVIDLEKVMHFDANIFELSKDLVFDYICKSLNIYQLIIETDSPILKFSDNQLFVLLLTVSSTNDPNKYSWFFSYIIKAGFNYRSPILDAFANNTLNKLKNTGECDCSESVFNYLGYAYFEFKSKHGLKFEYFKEMVEELFPDDEIIMGVNYYEWEYQFALLKRDNTLEEGILKSKIKSEISKEFNIPLEDFTISSTEIEIPRNVYEYAVKSINPTYSRNWGFRHCNFDLYQVLNNIYMMRYGAKD